MVDELTLVDLDKIASAIGPLAIIGPTRGLAVTGVVFDSREVSLGSLFCCLPGERADGHRFAGEARRAGAAAFLCEHSLGDLAHGATQLVVAPGGARAAMAKAACAFYDNPSAKLKTFGVTGTNGKTTTTYLLRSILEQHGLRAGVIGTLDGARTTPESPHLQRALARQLAAGVKATAIEVTSHALVLNRVDGIVFDVALFTNLSQDHLDYHKSMEAYFEAKARLFTPERAKLAVVNADDAYGRRLLDRPLVPTVSFSLGDVRDLEIGLTTSTFRLGGERIRLPLGGEFNVRNAVGAAAAASSLGIPTSDIVAGLESAPPVPGRFETIESSDGVVVVVDYAHTPAGLEEVLCAARKVMKLRSNNAERPGKVIVVFGAGGDRDRTKRPAMGEVASRRADRIVLTSDNPRSEDPAAIAKEVMAGIGHKERVTLELDRRNAIAAALSQAASGDLVVVAGRGHETTQQFATKAVPFDDREVVREELQRQGRGVRDEREVES